MSIADALLHGAIQYEHDRPRSQQFKLGPSQLGGCREYIRNIVVGTPVQHSDEWPAAAVVGTLLGDYFESIAEHYLGAQTQVPVRTTLPNGLAVEGTADIVLSEENALVDMKSKDELTAVRKDGPSLENLVQVSVYTLGLVQAGVLSEGATAHLIYADRSGREQVLYEVELSWERVQYFIDACMSRLDDVMEAQELIDQGITEAARGLRDKTPPFCYSPRVMCPFRDACWKGSEWVPREEITDIETVARVARYVEVKDEIKGLDAVRVELRDTLIGVSGLTPDGHSVTWRGNALYVTKVEQ